MGIRQVTVLIPTCDRPVALAVTLTALCFQELTGFDIVLSDQTEEKEVLADESIQTVLRLLRYRGHNVQVCRNLPRRGLAQQRQFLLDQVKTPYCLFIDDDILLEPYVIGFMLRELQAEGGGFVGQAVIGLSYKDDLRPAEQAIEPWEGPIQPEIIEPDDDKWQRYRLHNAANVLHVQEKLGATVQKPIRYKVAWVGGCVMYDAEKLRAAGGFEFWHDLSPEHCGEDVLAQLRVMKRYGGFGLLPSGAYHQEAPTTVKKRDINAPEVLR